MDSDLERVGARGGLVRAVKSGLRVRRAGRRSELRGGRAQPRFCLCLTAPRDAWKPTTLTLAKRRDRFMRNRPSPTKSYFTASPSLGHLPASTAERFVRRVPKPR
ncbi:hypothetical protein L1887_44550 [Cichorium endivia]|nr:hypothetical protein L1887_44550 [Cichorium endivia]